MIRHLLAWSPAALWAAALFYLSSLSLESGAPFVEIDDKLAHLLLYTVFGGALALGHRLSPNPPSHWRLFIIGLLYAVSDELHQHWVPGRTPDPVDLAADVAGLLLGYGVLLVPRGIRNRDDGGDP